MLSFAVLGCGRIGTLHAEHLAGRTDCRLACLYDSDAEAAEALAERLGCGVASSLADALARADAVLIATTPSSHADLIERCAQAGRAIFCEKPIDNSLVRVERCRRAIRGTGVPIQIGFNRRFDPGHREAWRAVRRGAVGTLMQLAIVTHEPEPPPRAARPGSGGIFRDMTIHDLDLARFLLGVEPDEVFAAGGAALGAAAGESFGDHDSAMLVLRTPQGTLCHISNLRRARTGFVHHVELVGSGGGLVSGRGAGPPSDHFAARFRPSYEAEITAFLVAVAAGRPPDVGFEDGRRALILAEAAVRSAHSGRAVRVEEIEALLD